MLTSSDDIDLGKPLWHRSASNHHHRYASRHASNETGCSTKETRTQKITTCPKAD
jgi:hypothetical protein